MNSGIHPANSSLHVGVLSNPLSGGNRKGLGAIREVLAENPRVMHCEVSTPEEVSRVLVDFARQDIEIVVVNGGDGTIQAVLTSLFHHKPFERFPMLALLRSGTTSMNAGDVGLKGPAPQALRQLIGWTGTRHRPAVILKRHILSVQAPGREPLYGMFFGAAAICQGIRFFHTRANTAGLRGELIPGLVIARFLLAAAQRDSRYVRPTSITMSMNGNPARRWDCLVVIVSTLERLFLGMRPFWGKKGGPVRFSAIRSNPRRLLRTLPHILRGHPGRYGTEENGYLSYNIDKLRLTLDSEFALDGELYRPEVELGPVVLKSAGPVSFLQL